MKSIMLKLSTAHWWKLECKTVCGNKVPEVAILGLNISFGGSYCAILREQNGSGLLVSLRKWIRGCVLEKDHIPQPPWESNGRTYDLRGAMCFFHPDCGTLNQIFILSWILEGSWEFAQPDYMFLLTLPKLSFVTDSVPNFCGQNFSMQPGVEGVQFKSLRIASLLFADDVVFLASLSCDLQWTLGQFVYSLVLSGWDEIWHFQIWGQGLPSLGWG